MHRIMEEGLIRMAKTSPLCILGLLFSVGLRLELENVTGHTEISLFFALNFLLRFDLVIFASKRNEGENFFASKESKFG
jgi:hypothetical protein